MTAKTGFWLVRRLGILALLFAGFFVVLNRSNVQAQAYKGEIVNGQEYVDIILDADFDGRGPADMAETVLDKITSSVVFLFDLKIEANTREATPIPLGTAFLVEYTVPVTEARHTLFVTAKHVVKYPDKTNRKRFYIRFYYEFQDGRTRTFFVPFYLQNERELGNYWEHPQADVVVFRAIFGPERGVGSIPAECVATATDFATGDVGPTDRIIFPGLLPRVPGTDRDYPVVRDGSIAFLPNEPVLFINGYSFPGASGSPVFVVNRPEEMKKREEPISSFPRLAGIIIGGVPAVAEWTIGNATVQTAEHSGISVAVPAWRLREIFEQDDFLATFKDHHAFWKHAKASLPKDLRSCTPAIEIESYRIYSKHNPSASQHPFDGPFRLCVESNKFEVVDKKRVIYEVPVFFLCLL